MQTSGHKCLHTCADDCVILQTSRALQKSLNTLYKVADWHELMLVQRIMRSSSCLHYQTCESTLQLSNILTVSFLCAFVVYFCRSCCVDNVDVHWLSLCERDDKIGGYDVIIWRHCSSRFLSATMFSGLCLRRCLVLGGACQKDGWRPYHHSLFSVCMVSHQSSHYIQVGPINAAPLCKVYFHSRFWFNLSFWLRQTIEVNYISTPYKNIFRKICF